MTGIAWDGKTLAADRACFVGEQMYEYRKLKVIQTRSSGFVMYAGCGSINQILEIERWLEEDYSPGCGQPRHVHNENPNAPMGIVVTNVGHAYSVFANGHMARVLAPIHADGSALEYLFGCLHSGLTAAQAVQRAVDHRSDCGYGVDYFDWEDLNSLCDVMDFHSDSSKSLVAKMGQVVQHEE